MFEGTVSRYKILTRIYLYTPEKVLKKPWWGIKGFVPFKIILLKMFCSKISLDEYGQYSIGEMVNADVEHIYN